MKPPQGSLSLAAAQCMFALMFMPIQLLQVDLDTYPVAALTTTKLCQLRIVV